MQFKYIDSETFNQAALIQFIDNGSDSDFFMFCMKFCFQVKDSSIVGLKVIIYNIHLSGNF